MGQNVFLLIGNILHSAAITILLVKLITTKSCAGISGRSQILFAFVYTTRCLNMFATCDCLYNSSLKILFTVFSYITLLLMFYAFRKTYEHKEDAFLTELLIIPCLLLATWVNQHYTQILWEFSTYLEAVAILPQFYMIYKKKQMDKSMFCYLLALGLYRVFYIFHWAHQYCNKTKFNLAADGPGFVNVFLYLIGATAIVFNGIKIGKENGTFLKQNIFFISNKESLSERLISSYERVEIEKNSAFTESEVGKFEDKTNVLADPTTRS